MKIINTNFHGLKIIKGINYHDKRGYLREIFKNSFLKNEKFIFWCISRSKKNVIRGLHLQTKFKQGKFVSVIKGKIFYVVLDLRKKSKTYGKHHSITLSDKNSTSLFIPAGFAHGYCGIENENIVFTSGAGGIFKSGIPIGKIEKKYDSPNLNVNFFSDFSQLRFVKVVSFKKEIDE